MKPPVPAALAATPHTLVCFALKEEAIPFRKAMGARPDIAIMIGGIGRKNSETNLRARLRQAMPLRVFTCGFAGGLDPTLTLGQVIFASEDATLRTALASAGALPVRFHCAHRIASTATEKRALREATQADAVEMESEAIQAICREQGLPCATVRVISDTAHEDMPLDFNLLAKPDQSLDFGKLALAIARSPGKIPALMRLQKHTSQAAENLSRVLMQVLARK